MADMSNNPLGAAESERDFAIRVENVSKVYGLWSSPSARLKYPLANIGSRLLPASLGSRVRARAAGMYREFKALHDVSLEIKKGESWGIIGVNGSGKSTLLKMIAGNLRPSAGRVVVEGKVAILDFSSGLHGGFTGRENVYLKAAMHGMSRREIDSKFQSIADFADIGDFIDQPVKTYSSGMTARLGFAILAHVDADIIITDEALAVGDAFFVQKCMDFIRTFLKRGTFLFVSHSTGDVVSLCQNAVWMDHGTTREVGSAKEVAEAYLSSQSLRRSREYLERTGDAALNGDDASEESELKQPRLSTLTHSKPPRQTKDPRLEYINRSPWRNDIQLPEFSSLSQGYGVGGARIETVAFTDESGTDLTWMIGGEVVCLRIAARADRDLASPIIGFQVKDRLGQTLFADNTFLVTAERPLLVKAGERFEAQFRFQLPLLPVGDYAIRAAVATGSESDNAMMHNIDTALVFRSTTSSARHGLVGVPMHSIRISLARQAEEGNMKSEPDAAAESAA